jgi:hypothetical protein
MLTAQLDTRQGPQVINATHLTELLTTIALENILPLWHTGIILYQASLLQAGQTLSFPLEAATGVPAPVHFITGLVH